MRGEAIDRNFRAKLALEIDSEAGSIGAGSEVESASNAAGPTLTGQ
jgi:hypothetical protein